MADREPEMVLLEARCGWCDETFDVWGERTAEDGKFLVDPERLACPGCLVRTSDVEEKEAL